MAAIPFVQGTSILEIGHGPGHLQHQLWERGEKPIGLDASAFMGKIAKRNLRAIPKGGWLVRGKAQDMPFPGEFFSCIVATFPSEYILDPKTLGEIYRTLIKGGRFVVIPAAWITGRKWLDRFVAWVFRITLQSPLMEEFRNMYLERVNKAGFEVSLRDVELISSQLLIILADKSIE